MFFGITREHFNPRSRATSEQQTPTPFTYEGILEHFRQTTEETARQFRETDRKFQEKMDQRSQEAYLRRQELEQADEENRR